MISEFIKSWELFVKNLDEVATIQLQRRRGTPGYSKLASLLKSVVGDILGERGLGEMRLALDREMTDDEAAVT